MKQFKKMILVGLVSVALLASSIVFAQGWGGNAARGPRFAQQQSFNQGQGWVLGEEMYNAKINVLSELSGRSQTDVKAKLQYKPLWAVLDEFKVDFPTYQSKMQEKAKAIVAQAVTDGKITKVQGDFMLERMANAGTTGMGSRGFGGGRGPGRGMGPCGW
jgi:hypothetical protein